MSSDVSPDTPIARALKEKLDLQKSVQDALLKIENIGQFLDAHNRLPPDIAISMAAQIAPLMEQQKELQAKLQAQMKRIQDLDQFLTTYRSLFTPADAEAPPAANEQTFLGRAGHGFTQGAFEQFVLMILRDAQRPMRSGEIVDEFRKRGNPIGGSNETKTAWNRLWQAKRDGKLAHHPSLGYWLPNQPITPEVEAAALEAQEKRRRDGRSKGRRVRRARGRHGRSRILSDAQIKVAQKWLASGEKTITEICAEFGGISPVTLTTATGRVGELREKFPELAAQAAARPRPKHPYRFRKPGAKKLGRPSSFTGEKLEQAEAMFLRGATMKEIAEAADVNLTTVYRHFGLDNREDWEKRKAEYQAQMRNRR